MEKDESNLQKIDLNTSVLVPKINLDQTKEGQESGKTESQPTTAVKKSRWVGKVILCVLGLLVIFLTFNLIAGYILLQKGKVLMANLKDLSTAAKSQDLVKIKNEIQKTENSLSSLSISYKLVAWEKFLPYAGPFIADAGHGFKAGQAGLVAGKEVLDVITPYADLLGFKGGSENVLAAQTGEQTTQERIDFIVKTIPNILPKIDLISAQVKIIQDEISQINPDRYPEKYKNQQIRPLIVSAQNLVSEAAVFIVNGKPFLESAPHLLGMDSPRTYLLLFQNDKELRPTGGFLTAYAIMKVDKAKFDPVSSSDIYTLDAIYKPSIPAPSPIVTYIKGPYILSKNWRLRDMNWSPDFATSMEIFLPAAQKAGIGKIDGVIAVDTQLLVNLLDVIGPIGVPGFGNFSTKVDPQCNCPQVIHELEAFADVEGPIIWDPLTGKIIQRPPNSDNRKKIIGPLMNSILANAFGQPKDKLPKLVEAAFKSLMEKHVLFYMFDEKTQAAISEFGVGGRIKTYDKDYLHINDANLGGRKSNLYAYEEVQQDIKISSDGSVTKTVTITYKNPAKQDGWLNSVLPNWVRVYVPKGSTLLAAEGLSAKTDSYEDLGKTVFSGYFQLRPEGVSKVTFQYKLPFKVTKDYKLLIQKQPGTDGFLYTVNIGKHSEEFYLKADKEISIEI